MKKCISIDVIYVLCVFVAMSAGCAKHDVIKQDDGIKSTSYARQSESPQKVSVPPAKQADNVLTPQTNSSQSASQAQSQKSSEASELQSILEKIYFDFDSTNLSESARNTLAKNATALAKDASSHIRIEGNCDERGSAEYNLALGEKRAKAAQQYLITMGIKPDRLSIVSFGKEKPVAQGNDETAWSQNRRDEFVVIAK